MSTASASEVQKAITLYNTTLQQGDGETARLYLINALSHDPCIENIRFYVQELLKVSPADLEGILPQSYSILSEAAITGPADNIAEIRTLIARLEEHCSSAKSDVVEVHENDEERRLLDELKATSWEGLKADGLFDADNIKWDVGRLVGRLELLKKALSSGYLTDEQAEYYAEELPKTELQINFCSSYNEFYRLAREIIDAIAINGDTIADDEKLRYIAKIQQMSNLLNQVSTMPDEGLGESGSDDSIYNRTSKMIGTFKTVEGKLQLAIGVETFKAVESEIDAFVEKYKNKSDASGGSWTICIRMAQALKDKTVRQISLMPAPQHQENVANKIKNMDKLAEEWMKARYAAYQRCVADLCRKAVKNWDDNVTVSKDEAKQWLNDYRFAEVNESLLSPEAAGVFQSIKSRLMEKLSKEDKANFDYKCIVSHKMKLEDF